MKYQGNERRNIKVLATLTAIVMILGVFSVFPAMASGFVGADLARGAVADLVGMDAGAALPDYIVYDHNYIAKNLSGDNALNTTEPCWSYVSTQHYESEGFVRFNVDVTDSSQTAIKDPYIAMELEKNSEGKGKYRASDYNYITIIVRKNIAKSASFELFFETDTGYNRWWIEKDGATNVRSTQYADTENWQVLTFDLTRESAGLKSVRLDFLAANTFTDGESVDIAAVILNKDGDAVYESSYAIMESLYNPVQILKDFSEEYLGNFTVGMNPTNKVSIVDGNVVYKSVYVEGKDYSDPYAGFRYDLYIDAKNEGLEENDPGRLQKLTPMDFRYVVLKFRKAPDIPDNHIQLFVYTNKNNNSATPHHCPAGSHPQSVNYGWRTICVDMNAGTKGEFVDYWYDENATFGGFRVDWAGNGYAGAFLELDEILFFNDEAEARAFSKGLNNIPAPTEYTVSDDGETYIPSLAGETYLIRSASELLALNKTETNGTLASAEVDGKSVAALLSDGNGAPSVSLSGLGVSASNFETVAFAVKAVGGTDEKFDLAINYKTDTMQGVDQAHKLIAQGVGSDGWQIVSFDMSDVSDWTGSLESFTVECVSQSGNYTEGSGLYIHSVAFCFYPENAVEYAMYASELINTPKQVIADFKSGDKGYFSSGAAATDVSVVDGNMKFTATASSKDPQTKVLYKKFMNDSTKYKAITTDDFNYITIRYRAENLKSNHTAIDLYILDKNYAPILTYPDIPGNYICYASKTVKYSADGEWHVITIDMTNGGKNEPVWQGDFYGVRFDWCNQTQLDPESYFEIDSLMFFENKETAEAYEAMLNNIVSVKGEDINSNPDDSETLPDFPGGDGEETETETLPPFPGGDNEETTDTETLPSFPGGDGEETDTETLPQIPGGDATETETLPSFPGGDDTDTETQPQIPDNTEDVGSDTVESTEAESDSDSDDSSTDSSTEEESTTEEEHTSDGESTAEEESSTDAESDTEGESDSEEESKPEIILPVDPAPNAGNDADGEEELSETPFLIACVVLGGLSVASVVTVVFIKIKMRRDQ